METLPNPNLENFAERKRLLDHIKSAENMEDKKRSLRDYEIYNDRIYRYVYDKLASQLSAKTAASMPIVANLNIAKRISDKKAGIYNTAPERVFTTAIESDSEIMDNVYSDFGFNTMLSKANKYQVLRNQTWVQVVAKDKKLCLRVLQRHHIDVIPDLLDPEKAYAYIISSFDKAGWIDSDGSNLSIADRDDYKQTLERYQVWTAETTFTMDGKGNYIEQPMPNPIGVLPFIDIAKDKDFEFFVRQGQALTDFTVDLNCAWSDLMYISRMQGYSVGVLTGDPNLKPDNMIVGPNRLIFLPSNPNNPDSKLELDFKSPQPNLEASLKVIESLVTTFLSTRGADLKSVQVNNNGGQSYSSAIERLLALIEEFDATKDDFDLFQVVEHHLCMITSKWLSVLSGSDQLDSKYWTTRSIESTEVSVQFHKPEMLETKSEMLDNAKKKLELGIADKEMILSHLNEITIDQAEQMITEIDERKINKLAGQMADKDKSFNGSQVTAMIDVVEKITTGIIPEESGLNILQAAFDVDIETAKKIISNAGTFKAKQPEVNNGFKQT